MNAAIRPYMTTGIALVGASVIAVAPIKPVTTLPDISIPMPTISSQAYELTAFPEDLLNLVGPLLAQLDPGQVFDLLEDVILANGGLFGGLALVVNELLEGLTDLLAQGVPPVLDALVPVLQTVFAGLSLVVLSLVPVVLSLVPVVATLLGGLAVIVGELVPVLLPVTLGLGALLGGLPLVLLPVTLGLGALLAGLGGLGGIIPLAAATPALAGATTFGATDVANGAAAQTFDLAIGPTEKGQEVTLPEPASDVAEAATEAGTEEPTAVLTEVQANLPEQANGAGLETAIEKQETVTATTGPESGAATETADSTANSGTTTHTTGSGASTTGSSASESGASHSGGTAGTAGTAGTTHSGNSGSDSAGGGSNADSSE
jgi:hypothetical protein